MPTSRALNPRDRRHRLKKRTMLSRAKLHSKSSSISHSASASASSCPTETIDIFRQDFFFARNRLSDFARVDNSRRLIPRDTKRRSMSTTRARLFERAASALSTRRSTHVNVTRDVIHVIPTRAYARPTLKGVNPTPSAASGARSGIRLNRTSSNVIAEPYAGPLRRPTIVQALTTSLGWRYVVDSALGKAKDAYALSKCAKEIKGFTLDGFKAEAKQLYRMINATSASTSGTRALSHETRHATTDKCRAT